MITVKLMGGLGNQMFQYASAYGIAKKRSTKLRIDRSWYDHSSATSAAPRQYELDCFNLSVKSSSKVTSLFNKYLGSKATLYSEKSLRFDPTVFTVDDSNIILDGYWQSEKYFIDVREEILREFTFISTPTGSNVEVANAISKTLAVSLHVRRGDYANHAATNSVHGLMGLDYYKTAVESIATRFPEAHFYIFSDDAEWCKKNLPITQPHTFVAGNEKGCFDMQLMTMCNHHIIANSSFSWWGAWLNPRDDKVIIAPKQWFNDGTMDAQDLVPKSWERL